MYAIIPLSPLAGMISWAENSKTYYKLITFYTRIKQQIIASEASDSSQMVNLAHFEANSLYPLQKDHFKLNNLQRLEVYQNNCQFYDDIALREAIWVQSNGPEMWFIQKLTSQDQMDSCLSLVISLESVIGI